MLKNKDKTEGFPRIIDALDDTIAEIIFCFDKIGEINQGEEEKTYLKNNEKLFYKLTGNYTSLINHLLDVYFENTNNRKVQLKYKPDILYFRQVHEYLVYLIRYPEILNIPEHDEIKQTRYFLENKEQLKKNIYEGLAEKQTAIFEGNFQNKLNEALGNHLKSIGLKDKIEKKHEV
ncbi:MAG: hypothetical protein ACTSWY_02400 [Promethearchaeota archaeon]